MDSERKPIKNPQEKLPKVGGGTCGSGALGMATQKRTKQTLLSSWDPWAGRLSEKAGRNR